MDQGHVDKLIPDDAVLQSIRDLFSSFHQFYPTNQEVNLEAAYRALTDTPLDQTARGNSRAARDRLGFAVERGPSTLPQGGDGVFVTSGRVPRGTVVAFYPGKSKGAYLPGFLCAVLLLFSFWLQILTDHTYTYDNEKQFWLGICDNWVLPLLVFNPLLSFRNCLLSP